MRLKKLTSEQILGLFLVAAISTAALAVEGLALVVMSDVDSSSVMDNLCTAASLFGKKEAGCSREDTAPPPRFSTLDAR